MSDWLAGGPAGWLAGWLAGGAWPVCPHVYPSVSELGSQRCGVKDGEPGRCTAIKW